MLISGFPSDINQMLMRLGQCHTLAQTSTPKISEKLIASFKDKSGSI